MFKKFFNRSEDEPEVRSLNHPRDLRLGDAIRIGFDEHPEISNKDLFVVAVNGLDLAEKSGFERRVLHLTPTDDGRPLFMWLDRETGEERLAFAYGATQPHVEEMIDLDQFAQLFQPDYDYLVEVESRAEARAGNPWLAAKYVQDQGQEAYLLEADPAGVLETRRISEDEKACDYFRLSAADRSAAIEVFVFDGGRTDVHFVKYLPLYKIEEMMPSI